MIYIRDLIKKKRNKEELSEEEIDFFIQSYNKNEILKEQASALLTLININGLTIKEMTLMANSIVETGEKMDIYELSNKVVDIHPIGGMDDKIILMLLAITSALGLPTIKVISREIGIKDKLLKATVHRYSNENREKLKELINSKSIVLLEEPEKLAPVENKLYKLRNDIACNDDISIIAINLMSQKIALGFRNIIFDISYGEKAYVKTLSDAQKLSRYLAEIGSNINRNVRCIITRLDEPVGNFFGNIIELQESLECLNGNMPKDIEELLLEIGDIVIQMENTNLKQNKQAILEVIKNKSAYNELLKLVNIDKNAIDCVKAKQIIPVMSTMCGYVETIDMSLIRITAQYLSAIRHNNDKAIEYGTGLELCKKIGDKVEVGDLLGYIHTNDETKVQKSVSNLKNAFNITNEKVKRKNRIVKVL